MGYSPEQLAVIEASARLSPGVEDFIITLGGIGEDFGALFLRDIEEMLRAIESPHFLIAVPIARVNSDELVSLLPQTGTEKEYPYFLIGLSPEGRNPEISQATISSLMLALGIDGDQNLKNLENTGILLPRPGTSLARELKAPYN